MNKDAVQVIKQAILRDFSKNSQNVEHHRAQMNDAATSTEYKQAARQALDEWQLLRSACK